MPPLYQKIADELREKIRKGELRAGDRLPTEPQLMDQYQVSRNTIRLATGLLVNEGLVESVPGRSGGMLVRDRLTLTFHASRAEFPTGPYAETDAWRSEVADQGHEASQEFELRIEALPAELAQRLGVEVDSHAAVRRCIRFVNGQASSVQDTYYPMDLCQQVTELLSPRDIPQGTTRLLAARGYEQVAYEDEILARMPNPAEAQLLDLPPGTPVLLYIRTGFTNERAVRVSVTSFAGDRNRLAYTLGDSAVIGRFHDREEEPQ
ncbi:GntR family transcriptional regulator [Micromonospora sp. NPDC093277]|uniref:GntR family transcriptional regulator n=1 Tax=Micromonospora sp. NPDC093277 TaxID=3364291 RepID=UPI00380A4D6A